MHKWCTRLQWIFKVTLTTRHLWTTSWSWKAKPLTCDSVCWLRLGFDSGSDETRWMDLLTNCASKCRVFSHFNHFYRPFKTGVMTYKFAVTLPKQKHYWRAYQRLMIIRSQYGAEKYSTHIVLTHLKADGLNLWYIWMILNCLTVLNYVWLGSEIGIKHYCMHIVGLIVFNYRTQIKSIIAFDPVHFTEQ